MRFKKAHPEVEHSFTREYADTDDCPIIGVTWYEAVQYCRWLSEQEGIPEEQMCYPNVAEIERCKDAKTPLKLPADHLSRTGYRLPTEAEWEYACRAGSKTSWFYGSSRELLAQYAWYSRNAENRTWPVGQKKPNSFGLFDMHGNTWDWCQDGYADYKVEPGDRPTEDVEDKRAITDRFSRVLRGGSFLHDRRYVARPTAVTTSGRPTASTPSGCAWPGRIAGRVALLSSTSPVTLWPW